jgi:NADH-quinone oxidoreductase subunit J
MVLFLFVVMLLNAQREEELPGPGVPTRSIVLGGALSLALLVELVWALMRLGVTGFSSDEQAISSISSVSRIGSSLFTTHAFAFEVTSILILVSMVGAVVIARRAP